MDLGPAVVANEQALEVMQPGEGALDDPSHTAQPGAVLGLAAGDLGPDPALTQLMPVLVMVVAAVGGDQLGPPARAADDTPHRRYPLEKRDQLGNVVAVATGQSPGERDPGRID